MLDTSHVVPRSGVVGSNKLCVRSKGSLLFEIFERFPNAAHTNARGAAGSLLYCLVRWPKGSKVFLNTKISDY